MKEWPEGALGKFCAARCIEFACTPPADPPSLPAGALFLTSLTFVVDELGVPWAEPAGDRLSVPEGALPCEGEAVPDAESFFLEALFESLALDNCSCYMRLSVGLEITYMPHF
jgi:hypothetical protein